MTSPIPWRATLDAQNIHHRYGDLVVLDGVDLSTQPGQRIGIVGENGSGKSTLLRILAGVEDHTSGDIARPSDLGYLPQDDGVGQDAATQDTIAQLRDQALAPGRALLAKIGTLGEDLASSERTPSAVTTSNNTGISLVEEFDELLQTAHREDLWNLEPRADQVFAQLGLSHLAHDREIASLSGGERSRLSLAALLIRRPSALILDEPTNHLDEPAMRYLTQELQRFQGVIVLASHDRVFLDDVCTDIVDLDPVRPSKTSGGARRYGGTFSHYLREREIERKNWEEQYRNEQTELRQLRISVDETSRQVGHNKEMQDRNKMSYGLIGQRVEGQIARRIRNAQLRLDSLTRDQVAPPPVRLQFTQSIRSNTSNADSTSPPSPGLSATGIQSTGRLAATSLTLQQGDHVLITGGNGSGKSTLLALLQGRLAPDRGTIAVAANTRIAILDQDIVFPNPEVNARAIFAALAEINGPDAAFTAPSKLGLLRERDIDRPVGELSIGQRRRIALAVLLTNPPDILLLDEPTNHLSPALSEELEASLAASKLTIVIATHDRWLRSRWPATHSIELHPVS